MQHGDENIDTTWRAVRSIQLYVMHRDFKCMLERWNECLQTHAYFYCYIYFFQLDLETIFASLYI